MIDPLKDRAPYVRERRLGNEMISRGDWDQVRAERLVKGFYKFNPPFVELNPYEYSVMREADPGLPEWDVLLKLLEGSELRSLVKTTG